MSKHIIIDTNSDAVVCIGYDRPLDYVHCTVEQNGDVTYFNLDDPKAGTEQQEVEYFRPVLAGLGIMLPQEIYDEVIRDQDQGVGNREETYRLAITQLK